MTEYVLSIDPGVSTGVALLAYDESSVWLDKAWQFNGGAMSLLGFCNYHFGWDEKHGSIFVRTDYPEFQKSREIDPDWYIAQENYGSWGKWPNFTVITEKFTARATHGFSYTTASLEPLRAEGVLLSQEVMPDYDVKEKRWRDPGAQYVVGGKDLPSKRKRQHKFLEESGFYRTNKDFPDSPPKDKADDFRSACAHGIAYLAREKKHAPSFKLMTDWSEIN